MTTNIKKFRIDTGGINLLEMKEKITGDSIVSFSIPKNQTLECAWILRFTTEQGNMLIFSSDVGSIDGWQESGFIKLMIQADERVENESIFSTSQIVPFKINDVALISYICDEFTSECGVVLVGEHDLNIIVSTSPAPGAVSVDAFFSKNTFSPEFPTETCQVARLRNPAN